MALGFGADGKVAEGITVAAPKLAYERDRADDDGMPPRNVSNWARTFLSLVT